MPSPLHTVLTSPVLRRRLLVLGLAVAAVWIALFDSHSLMRRVQYYYEYRTLASENAQLQAEIEALEERVRAAPSDEVIEEVAREQYGMRRPGERVYPVE